MNFFITIVIGGVHFGGARTKSQKANTRREGLATMVLNISMETAWRWYHDLPLSQGSAQMNEERTRSLQCTGWTKLTQRPDHGGDWCGREYVYLYMAITRTTA